MATAHVDTFARDRLPPPEALPEILLDQPFLRFPARLNCATELLDRHVAEGRGGRTCPAHARRPTLELRRAAGPANRIATSRPTLALLGDNRSGQELVIPSENIKSDQASGEVRSSIQPVNIVNVVTEQDFHRIMASQAGKNIIVNTVGQDMQKRGTTFRYYNM